MEDPAIIARILESLATNGPWAVVAGVLMWQLVKERSEDRKLITETLTALRLSMDALKGTLDRVGDEQVEVRRQMPTICRNYDPLRPPVPPFVINPNIQGQ